MRVVIPLPDRDFDPTEVAVSWDVLRGAGIDVVFATPGGGRASGDRIMIDGRGLSVFGGLLRANADARAAYARLERDPAFAAPRAYADLRVADFDGLLLPGGHRARGMRAYLESAVLQRFVGEFFDSEKPVAAICHGVVLAARSHSQRTGEPVLRAQDDRADLAARACRLAARAHRTVLGSRLLPHVSRTAGRPAGLPQRAGRGHPCARVARGLPRRPGLGAGSRA
jgi:putative intracellular protease/amidase